MNSYIKLINQLKLAVSQQKLYCKIPYSNINVRILMILLSQGYFYGINLYDSEMENKKYITVKLKYYHNKSTLQYIKIRSKPGSKQYWSYKKLNRYLNSMKGLKVILSTNKGIIDSEQALNNRIGGEIIFEYY